MIALLAACASPSALDEAPAARAPNQPPAITSLVLEPDPARAGDTLTAAVDADDPDGDPVELHYLWELDGRDAGIDEPSLPPRTARAGQEVRVTVSVTDGWAWGPAASAELVLVNSAPVVDAIAIAPDPPGTGQDLTCEVEVRDDDGDPLEMRFRWWTGLTPLGEEQVLPASAVELGLPIRCEVFATDGDLDTGWVSSREVTVVNGPPPPPTIELVPDPPVPCSGGEVRIVEQPPDPDGDPVSYRVTWRDAHGNAVATDFTYPAGTFVEDAAYEVEVVPTDGVNDGEPAVLGFVATPAGEILGDGADNDCDGIVDEWIERAWQAQQLGWGDLSEGQEGHALVAGDLDGDGLADLALVRAGGADVVVRAGADLDPASPVVPAPRLVIGGAEAASSLGIGDTTGDGVAELLVPAPGDDAGGTDAGAVRLVSALGSGAIEAPEAATWWWEGEAVGERLGEVAALGDLDGDGLADAVIGEPAADAPGRDSGRVRVVLSPLVGAAGGADITLEGVTRELQFGRSLAILPDIDGDGRPDLAVGAPYDDGNGADAGRVALWGAVLADADLEDAPVTVLGATGDQLGAQPAAAGDVDGDAVPDLAASAGTGASRVGILAGIDLRAGGTFLLDDAPVEVVSADAGGWWALQGSGPTLADLDGDGLADLAAGASGSGLLLAFDGALLAAGGSLDAEEPTLRVEGEDAGDQFGRWVATADTDGDGRPDLVVTASRSDGGASRGGAFYVFRPPWGEPAERWSPDCDAEGDRLACRTPLDWASARAACQDWGGDLAAAADAAEAAELADLAARHYPPGGVRGRFWMGLHDPEGDGSWQWLDDPAPTGFDLWTAGAPASGSCAALNQDASGAWIDLDCGEELFFLCELAP